MQTAERGKQKNGKKKDRYIERNSIGESLINTAKMWLKYFGYEENVDEYVDKMVLDNDVECLPDEVREKIQIHDCYVQVPLSEEKITDLKNDIISTIHDIHKKEEEYRATHDEKIFWQDVTAADEFRLATLSGYSRQKHKPYDSYLKQKELFLNKENNTEDDELIDFINSL